MNNKNIENELNILKKEVNYLFQNNYINQKEYDIFFKVFSKITDTKVGS